MAILCLCVDRLSLARSLNWSAGNEKAADLRLRERERSTPRETLCSPRRQLITISDRRRYLLLRAMTRAVASPGQNRHLPTNLTETSIISGDERVVRNMNNIKVDGIALARARSDLPTTMAAAAV